MRYKSFEIDPIRLWSNYCNIKEDDGPHLPLTFCPNPNHNNINSPAFQINIWKPVVHCFTECGISGSYAHAIAVIDGLYDEYGVDDSDIAISYTKAKPNELPEIRHSRIKVHRARKQAEKRILKYGVATRTVKRRKHSATHKKAVQQIPSSPSPVFLEENLEQYLEKRRFLPKEALAYLKTRKINSWSIAKWEIGFDEESGYLLIPVRDTRNRLVFIQKRAIYEYKRPKYLNPPDSVAKALLFGACMLDEGMVSSQGLVVVEGSFDCVRLHQHGFRNTVATLGSSISRKQLEIISRLPQNRIYLFFDPDMAGVNALRASVQKLKGYQIKIPLYPKGEKLDPAKLTKSQARHSIEASISLVELNRRIRNAGIKREVSSGKV